MEIVTLAERPDLAVAMWEMPNNWPAFMMEDPVAEVLFGRLTEAFADYQLIVLNDAGIGEGARFERAAGSQVRPDRQCLAHPAIH